MVDVLCDHISTSFFEHWRQRYFLPFDLKDAFVQCGFENYFVRYRFQHGQIDWWQWRDTSGLGMDSLAYSSYYKFQPPTKTKSFLCNEDMTGQKSKEEWMDFLKEKWMKHAPHLATQSFLYNEDNIQFGCFFGTQDEGIITVVFGTLDWDELAFNIISDQDEWGFGPVSDYGLSFPFFDYSFIENIEVDLLGNQRIPTEKQIKTLSWMVFLTRYRNLGW